MSSRVLKPKVSQLCAYCGINPGVEREHPIPKGFYPDPKPNDLITVPACSDCNRSVSNDEEYLRLLLVSDKRAYETSPAAQQLFFGPIKRSFQRGKTGLYNLIRGSLVSVEAFSQVGFYLGELPAIYPDDTRVQRVIEKMVRGLYFHYTDGNRLPKDHEVMVRANVDDDIISHALVKPFLQDSSFAHRVDKAIAFRAYQVADTPTHTAWFMSFYNSFYTFAATITPEKALPDP